MSTPTTTDSADFYALEALLDDDEQDFLHSVRDFMKSEVEPSVNQHWQRGSFPLEIVPGFRQPGLAGLPYHGFGCPGRSFLLDGMVAMELARTDPSIATFAGVHGGLSMGSIYLCGSDEQKQRQPANHGPIGQDRCVRADRTRRRIGRIARADDDSSPGRGFVDPQRPEEMDRQRDIRRPHGDLGQRCRRRPGQGVHRRERQPGFLRQPSWRTRLRCASCRTLSSLSTMSGFLRMTGCRTRTRSATPPRCCG